MDECVIDIAEGREAPSASAAVPVAAAPPRPALGRRFMAVWAGQTLSTVGSAMSAIGVAVHVFLETGSAFTLGALGAAVAAMSLLAAPFGPWIDRVDRRRAMIAADVLAALGPGLALVLAVNGSLRVWHLLLASLIAALGNAIQAPAAAAAVPQLVHAEALGRANGLGQLGPAVGVVVAPLAATPLVARWGIESVLVVDLVTFVVAVAATASVRFDPVPDHAVDAERVAGGLAGGWRWLRTSGRPLLALIVATAVVNLALGFFNVALQVLALVVGGAARAGLVFGVAGLAMVVGSLWLGAKGVPRRRVRVFATALGLMAAGSVLAAARPLLLLVLIGVALGLVAVPAVNASVSTIFHEQVPADLHGRVFAVRFAIGRSLDPIGTFLAGVLIATVTEPLMRADRLGGETVGRLIGTGEGRGAALVMVLVAVALGVLAVWLGRSPRLAELDGAPVAEPTPVD